MTKYGSVCKCCIHVVDGENSVITAISRVSFAKVKDCIGEWVYLDCLESEISNTLLNEHGHCIDHAHLFTGPAEYTACINSVNDLGFGYHCKCYMRFTNKQRIDRKKKNTVGENKATDREKTDNVGTSADSTQLRRTLRSEFSHQKTRGLAQCKCWCC